MSPRTSLIVFGVVLLAFSAYTAAVVAGNGYVGFLTLAAREPWGGQMFVDLVIALLLFASWMRADAATEGLPFWPYLVAILFTGSIGALAYLVHRSAHRLREGAAVAA
jgi:protein-S-isoprenylcysteine O-methyltransferase Ste14